MTRGDILRWAAHGEAGWFVSGPGGASYETCLQLVKDGLMRSAPGTGSAQGLTYFYTTPKGAAVATETP
jgi:hypothetical protein